MSNGQCKVDQSEADLNDDQCEDRLAGDYGTTRLSTRSSFAERLLEDLIIRPKPSSLPRAAFNLFKGTVGGGAFLIPTAYTEAGYAFGPVIALLCGVMVIDCASMVLRAKQRIARLKVQTYPEVAEFVFGRPMFFAISAALATSQLGFVLIYLQFAAGLIRHLVPPFDESYPILVVAGALVVTPMTFLSGNLRALGASSAVASVGVFYCLMATLGYSIASIQQHSRACSSEAIVDPAKWIMFTASSVTVIEGIGVVLPIENSVRNPEKFPVVLRATLSGIIAIYLVYGVVGYLAYGSALNVSLISIIPPSPLATTVQVAMAAQLLLTAPLQFVPAIQIVDRALGVKSHMILKSPKAWFARLGIMAILTTMASFMGPAFLGLLLAFIGSLAATFMAVTLPGLLEVFTERVLRLESGRSLTGDPSPGHEGDEVEQPKASFTCRFRKVRAGLYVVVGVGVAVVGTVTCVVQAIHFHHNEDAAIHRNAHDPLANVTYC